MRSAFPGRPLVRAVTALTVLLAGAGLAACSSGDSASGGDGTVTVYSGRNEKLVGPILERAGKALGLKVEVRYGSTSEMAAQLLEEGDRTPADLFLAQDAGALETVAAAGLFTALPQATLDRVGADYRAEDGTWVGITGRARALVVRPDLVASAPTSVFDLTDPAWKGQVGIAPTNASFQSFITAMRAVAGDEAAEKWLVDMKANGVRLFDNNIQIVEAVADGRIQVGLVNHYYLYELEKEKGAKPNAELVFTKAGDPGSLVNVAGAGITARGAKDPDAQALLDFLLGSEGQTYFAETVNEYPMTSDGPAPRGVPALADIPPVVPLSRLADLRGTLDMLQKVGLV